MAKNKCLFEGCGGSLIPHDNDKTPKGLFLCKKCKSLFRMMIESKKLVVVTNNFSTYKQKPIPLKELRGNKKCAI